MLFVLYMFYVSALFFDLHIFKHMLIYANSIEYRAYICTLRSINNCCD